MLTMKHNDNMLNNNGGPDTHQIQCYCLQFQCGASVANQYYYYY